jgi:hypothetical protein
MFKLSAVIALAVTITTTVAAPTVGSSQSLVARAGAPIPEPIHPAADANKCVGLVGGIFTNGTLVDM